MRELGREAVSRLVATMREARWGLAREDCFAQGASRAREEIPEEFRGVRLAVIFPVAVLKKLQGATPRNSSKSARRPEKLQGSPGGLSGEAPLQPLEIPGVGPLARGAQEGLLVRLGRTRPRGRGVQCSFTHKGLHMAQVKPADVAGMSREDLLKALAEARAEAERLKAKGSGGALKLKVSEKGAVSVYGLNSKWPVTLYGEQWKRLISYVPEIEKFLAENAGKLSHKE